MGDALNTDDPAPVELHDRMVYQLVIQQSLLVAIDHQVLLLSHEPQGLDDPGHKTGQIALGIRRVLAPDHRVAEKREIVTDEDSAAEADPDREGLVVAVPEPDRVGIVSIGRFQRQEPEVAVGIGGDRVRLLDDLVAVESEGVFDHVDDIDMGDRNMRSGRLGRLKRAQIGQGRFLAPGMQ